MKYLYVMRVNNDHYKVGIATNVQQRLKALQTSNSNKIDLVAAKLFDNTEAVEVTVHKQFSSKRTDGGTEWFQLKPEEVIDLLVVINRYDDPINLSQVLTISELMRKHDEDFRNVKNNMQIIADGINRYVVEKSQRIERANAVQKIARSTYSDDELEEQAVKIFKQFGRASTSLLQREMRIGYSKAARIISSLENKGLIGSEGSSTYGSRSI